MHGRGRGIIIACMGSQESAIDRVESPDQRCGESVEQPQRWVAASRELVKARIITALIVTPLPILAGVVLTVVFSRWWLFLSAPFVWALLHILLLSRRYVRSLAHCERENDILIREGVLSRTTTLIPYGRLQYVTLTEGPIDSRFGLAKVSIHTGTGGSTDIPGLPKDQARELRGRLADRSRGRDAGL